MSGQTDAQDAIFDAVEALAKAGAKYGGPGGAAMLRDAAYAWRAATGGQQPGGTVIVEK